MPRTRRNPARLTSLQKTTLPDPPEAQDSAIPTVARSKSQQTKSLAAQGVPASNGGKAISSIAPASEGGRTPSPRYNLRPRKVNQHVEKSPAEQAVETQVATVSKKTREREATRDNRKPTKASNQSVKPSIENITVAKDDSLLNRDLHKKDLDEPLEESVEQIPTNIYSLPESVSIPSYRWSEANDRFVSAFEVLGYQVPDSDSMESTRDTASRTSVGQRDRAQSVGPTRRRFDATLELRYVALDPSEGAEQEVAKRIRKQIDYTTKPNEEDEWTNDRIKSGLGNEAIFQHTIMIQAIDRHNLGKFLSYTCDATWESPALPMQADETGMAAPPPTTKPKPDLSVAFKRAALVNEVEVLKLHQLSAYMLPEGRHVRQEQRAFPFFNMEVKGASSDLKDAVSTRQSLNNASHALFNMWKFFEGEKIEKKFFDEVRVFSATGNGECFRFIIHWAEKVLGAGPGDPPLFFRHQHLELLSDRAYRKDKIVGTVKSILHYGTNDLLPLLQKAVKLQLQNISVRKAEALRAANQAASDAASSSTKKKRGNHSANQSGEPGTSVNKRQALNSTMSFGSTSSTGQKLDDTHLGSDQSFTEVAG